MPRSWKCANEKCEAEQRPVMCHKCGNQGFTETFKRVSIQSHIVEQYLREALPKEPVVKAITEFAIWFNNKTFEV